MSNEYLEIIASGPLKGRVSLFGAKNAALAIMAATILTDGVSILRNVPCSTDVYCMIQLLKDLGAYVVFDIQNRIVTIDTRMLNKYRVPPALMGKMRASMVVAGPLLARFGKAEVAVPGGCLIGTRPINFHLKAFEKMGVVFKAEEPFLYGSVSTKTVVSNEHHIVFEYPSVGATENILMLATSFCGTTTITNASLEPEVIDLITALQKMGAPISYGIGSTVYVQGGRSLLPIDYTIIPDRLEAGTIMLAASILGGEVTITNARASDMELFLSKLREMGHGIKVGEGGITIAAISAPRSVDVKTYPHPGFPTDLQAPMITAQALANGVSVIEETVFENRMMHVKELQKMGIQAKYLLLAQVGERYGNLKQNFGWNLLPP